MNAWANFIKQASTAQMIKPEWSRLSEKQIEYMQKQRAGADAYLGQIVAHLKEHGEMSTANLAADLRWKPDTAFRRCERGLAQGVLAKEVRWAEGRRGVYTNVTFWSIPCQ